MKIKEISSAERENAILDHIHKLGKEMMAACF